MAELKIYFAGSIRGGTQKKQFYKKIIKVLRTYGVVLTEHVAGLKKQPARGAKNIKAQDNAWIREADVLIADISILSRGVGYEIGVAETLGKPVILLYDTELNNCKISVMDDGPPIIKYVESNPEKLFAALDRALNIKNKT